MQFFSCSCSSSLSHIDLEPHSDRDNDWDPRYNARTPWTLSRHSCSLSFTQAPFPPQQQSIFVREVGPAAADAALCVAFSVVSATCACLETFISLKTTSHNKTNFSFIHKPLTCFFHLTFKSFKKEKEKKKIKKQSQSLPVSLKPSMSQLLWHPSQETRAQKHVAHNTLEVKSMDSQTTALGWRAGGVVELPGNQLVDIQTMYKSSKWLVEPDSGCSECNNETGVFMKDYKWSSHCTAGHQDKLKVLWIPLNAIYSAIFAVLPSTRTACSPQRGLILHNQRKVQLLPTGTGRDVKIRLLL